MKYVFKIEGGGAVIFCQQISSETNLLSVDDLVTLSDNEVSERKLIGTEALLSNKRNDVLLVGSLIYVGLRDSMSELIECATCVIEDIIALKDDAAN